MAKKLKYYTVFIDGIDKSGKDTIAKYVWRLDKRLNVFVRGWPSLVVYAKKFRRKCDYELPYQDALYVQCIVDKKDWQIRCSINNEKKIDFEKDSKKFDDAFDRLKDAGYFVLTADTSIYTPYDIAEQIVKKVKQMNDGEYL